MKSEFDGGQELKGYNPWKFSTGFIQSSGAILRIFGMPTDSFLLREVFSFCHEISLILKSKWRDLNSRLGGCGIYVSEIYFSIFLENKEEKTEVTLSLIL